MAVELDTTIPPVANNEFLPYIGKRIYVSGSRTFNTQRNGDFVAKVLNELSPDFVLHEGNDGTDRWVQWWCLQRATPMAIVPCHNQGRLRKRSLVESQHEWIFQLAPELVVAFPGVDRHVLACARRAGVPALSVTEDMFALNQPEEHAALETDENTG